jgi:hypothetical protein
VTAGEWWGPTDKDVDREELQGNTTAGPPPTNVRSRKLSIKQRDGSTRRTEVTPTIDEYFDRVGRSPRKQRKKVEPVWEPPATEVPTIIRLLDAREVDPSKNLLAGLRRVPAGTQGAMTWERVMDISIAQQVRRLRKPAPIDENRTEGDQLWCLSAGLGCENPVKYKTPSPSCRECWRYHYDHGHWPDADIISKRRARALKKLREEYL